jgi:hypothetical protein
MCRNIKPLRLPDRKVTDQEIAQAALQYVRKLLDSLVVRESTPKLHT